MKHRSPISPAPRPDENIEELTRSLLDRLIRGGLVIDGKLVRVASWYDNEWGFSNRMCDTAAAMGKL